MEPEPEGLLDPEILERLRYFRRTARLLEQMEKDSGASWSLAQAAEVAGMAPTAFSRFFHQEIGVTFSEFQRAFRIHLAIKMMMRQNLSIKELSQKVGFDHPATFSRNFKRQMGLTPRDYLMRWKAEGSPAASRKPTPGPGEEPDRS